MFNWNNFDKTEAVAQMKERLRLNGRMSRVFAQTADHAVRATADCACGGGGHHGPAPLAVLGGVTTPASIEAGNAKAWDRKPVLPQGFTADAGLAGPGNAPTPASMNARAAAVWKRPTA